MSTQSRAGRFGERQPAAIQPHRSNSSPRFAAAVPNDGHPHQALRQPLDLADHVNRRRARPVPAAVDPRRGCGGRRRVLGDDALRRAGHQRAAPYPADTQVIGRDRPRRLVRHHLGRRTVQRQRPCGLENADAATRRIRTVAADRSDRRQRLPVSRMLLRRRHARFCRRCYRRPHLHRARRCA